MRIGPSTLDRAMVAVCGVLTVLGVGAAGTGERAGWAVAAFFGGCTAVAAWRLARKERVKAHAGAESIEVEGHVPIQAPQTTVRWTAAGLVLVGGAGALFGDAIGVVFTGLSAFMVTVGATLGVASVLGLLERPFLQFEPAGLRLGEAKYSFVVEWNNLAKIGAAEVGGDSVVLIRLADARRLATTIQTRKPRDWAGHNLNRLLATNRRTFGCDVAIKPSLYGTDLALLLHALRRYAEDPTARRALVAKAALPAASGD